MQRVANAAFQSPRSVIYPPEYRYFEVEYRTEPADSLDLCSEDGTRGAHLRYFFAAVAEAGEDRVAVLTDQRGRLQFC